MSNYGIIENEREDDFREIDSLVASRYEEAQQDVSLDFGIDDTEERMWSIEVEVDMFGRKQNTNFSDDFQPEIMGRRYDNCGSTII